MGIREVFGLDSDRKVRYAIVGLGDIAQEDMMPGFEHTGNSQITALVTSDATKAKALSELHDVSAPSHMPMSVCWMGFWRLSRPAALSG